MTRTRFLAAVAACGAVLLALAPVGAAPIPKGAGKQTPTPEFKAAFEAAASASAAQKWPAEAEEKMLTDTARVAFERMLKAAEQKERALPVDFAKLTKIDPVAQYQKATLSDGFLIAGNVQITSARNCVIIARGDVKITGATNCVIVAQNVRCTSVENCFIVAGEFIRLTSARRRNGGDPSILLAGQWIRTTGMEGTICHVLRPGGLAAPDEARLRLNGPHPAIRTNGADNVIFLNAMDETGANGPKNCTYLPQKTPIAK